MAAGKQPSAPQGLFNRLCHLIELRRGSRIEDLVDRLVLTLVWVVPSSGSATPERLADDLKGYFGVELRPSLLRESIARLLASGRLETSPSGAKVPSSEAAAEISDRVSESVALERAVREEWRAGLPDDLRAPECADELWHCQQLFFARLFLLHGAETAQLLDPKSIRAMPVGDEVGEMLGQAAAETCSRVNKAQAQAEVRRFLLNPTTERVRYLKELMDGAFALFALGIDDATAQYLRGKLGQLAVFLDTNFVFSILGLNEDHPDTRMASEVLALIRRDRFPFTLYVHEETQREIQRTLLGMGERIRQERWTQAISRVAVRSGRFSGLELKYHQANAAISTDPDVFMERYQRIDLLVEEQGFTLYRGAPPGDADTSERGLMAADYIAFLESSGIPPKPYPAINHDVTVLRAVRTRRTRAKSSLAAGALLLSMDYTLRNFDWRVVRKDGEVGAVVMPGMLLQLLRPFAGGSPEFDRRFIEAFVLPEVRSAATFGSDIATRILARMNVYRDLREETALKILADEAVNSQLRGRAPSVAGDAEVIEAALAADNRLLLEEREAIRRQRDEEEQRHESTRQRLQELERIYSESSEAQKARDADAQRRTDDLERAAAAEAERVRQSEAFGAQKVADLAAARTRENRLHTVIVVLAVVLVSLLVVVPVAMGWWGLASAKWYPRAAASVVVASVAIGWAWVDPRNREWAIGRILFGVVLAVLLNLVGT